MTLFAHPTPQADLREVMFREPNLFLRMVNNDIMQTVFHTYDDIRQSLQTQGLFGYRMDRSSMVIPCSAAATGTYYLKMKLLKSENIEMTHRLIIITLEDPIDSSIRNMTIVRLEKRNF